MNRNLIVDKISGLKDFLKVSYIDSKYLEEALCYSVEIREKQNGNINNWQYKKVEEPYRKLENIGDRVIKLELTRIGYENCKSVGSVNAFTNNLENNIILAKIGTGISRFAYTKRINGDTIAYVDAECGGKHQADLLESVIGAIFLVEFERSGTYFNAQKFIRENIINSLDIL